MFCSLKRIGLVFFVLHLFIFGDCVFAKNFHKFSKKNIGNNSRTSVHNFNSYNNKKFRNPNFTTNTFVINYLKAILHRILNSNKDILYQYGMSEQEFTTNFIIQEDANAQANSIKQIVLVISEKDLLHTDIFNNDAYIAALFSHEISHILLKHLQKTYFLESEILKEFVAKYNNDKYFKNRHPEFITSSQDLAPAYIEPYKEYLRKHEKYIKLKRANEIEADNLGFKLFLKIGCDIEYYADAFINNSQSLRQIIPVLNYFMFRSLWLENYEYFFFRNSYTGKVRSTFTANFEEIGKDVELYQYTYNPNTDDDNNIKTHPTVIWRYWNFLKQEQNISENIKNRNKNINTTEYIQLDLSRFKELNYIRPYLNKNYISDAPLDLNKKDDPRVYISEALFYDGTNIKYNLFSSTSQDVNTIGVIQDDNTIILRANDVFRVASLSIAQDKDRSNKPCNGFFQ